MNGDEAPSAPRALVVSAHPDDGDVNAGGTIARWSDEGVVVTHLVVTEGDAGGYGSVSREEIRATRRAEQREAARILGVDDLRFLSGYLDGAVEVTQALVRDIVRVIRQVRPHRLMTLSPERDWRNIAQCHPDHLATGEASVRAFYPAAGNPFAFPELLAQEQLAPWTVDELWLQAPPRPDHAEDVTEYVDRKMRAVTAHVSQFEHPEMIDRVLREQMAGNAASAGLPEGRLAETFLRVRAG